MFLERPKATPGRPGLPSRLPTVRSAGASPPANVQFRICKSFDQFAKIATPKDHFYLEMYGYLAYAIISGTQTMVLCAAEGRVGYASC